MAQGWRAKIPLRWDNKGILLAFPGENRLLHVGHTDIGGAGKYLPD